MTDSALQQQSPVVVLGEVVDVAGSAVLNRPVTQYQVQIEEVLKGQVPASSIIVQAPGAPRPAANVRWVPGTPELAVSDVVVLFLKPLANGNYGFMHLGLGAFELTRNAQGELVFERDLADTLRLPTDAPLANAMNEAVRPAVEFLQSLGSQGQYNIDWSKAGSGSEYTTANFQTLGSPPSRWFEFDDGVNVMFLSHIDGQPGMTNDGVPAIQAALAAWTDDSGSNIRYVYGGTTNATAGFTSNDSINGILFDDPNDEVKGSFNCSEGGVLAAGGFVSSSSTTNYNGTQFSAISEADIVTNDGAGCYFGFNGDMSFGEEIFGHELGHTLGLDHSCGDGAILIIEECDLAGPTAAQALMRSTPHGDGRGASLNADDRAGAAFLYEQGASSTPPPDDGDGQVTMPDDPVSADEGGDEVVEDDTPENDGGNRRSSGGGGGCTLQPGAPIDPLFWLMSLASLAWLLRRKATACENQ